MKLFGPKELKLTACLCRRYKHAGPIHVYADGSLPPGEKLEKFIEHFSEILFEEIILEVVEN